jgi:hypothetical protein
MPPRFAYWTIILEGKPTAFRAQQHEDLVPTFKQLQAKHPDAVMMWFTRGRLWTSPEEAQAAERGRGSEPRKRDWRPGGEHRDPRARFDVPRDEKRRRFAAKQRRDFREGPLQGHDDRRNQFPDRPERPPGGSPGGPRQDHGGRRPDWKPRGAREHGDRPPERRPFGNRDTRPPKPEWTQREDHGRGDWKTRDRQPPRDRERRPPGAGWKPADSRERGDWRPPDRRPLHDQQRSPGRPEWKRGDNAPRPSPRREWNPADSRTTRDPRPDEWRDRKPGWKPPPPGERQPDWKARPPAGRSGERGTGGKPPAERRGDSNRPQSGFRPKGPGDRPNRFRPEDRNRGGGRKPGGGSGRGGGGGQSR